MKLSTALLILALASAVLAVPVAQPQDDAAAGGDAPKADDAAKPEEAKADDAPKADEAKKDDAPKADEAPKGDDAAKPDEAKKDDKKEDKKDDKKDDKAKKGKKGKSKPTCTPACKATEYCKDVSLLRVFHLAPTYKCVVIDAKKDAACGGTSNPRWCEAGYVCKRKPGFMNLLSGTFCLKGTDAELAQSKKEREEWNKKYDKKGGTADAKKEDKPAEGEKKEGEEKKEGDKPAEGEKKEGEGEKKEEEKKEGDKPAEGGDKPADAPAEEKKEEAPAPDASG